MVAAQRAGARVYFVPSAEKSRPSLTIAAKRATVAPAFRILTSAVSVVSVKCVAAAPSLVAPSAKTGTGTNV